MDTFSIKCSINTKNMCYLAFVAFYIYSMTNQLRDIFLRRPMRVDLDELHHDLSIFFGRK